ncbi:MAG: PAS domain S-box protein [Bryobacterales bacterium]|nr:PAS domain S-box protein [Bryobacterales bacterium]
MKDWPSDPLNNTVLCDVFWNASLDAMRLTDRDGMIQHVNDAFCRLMRKPREELLGQLFTCTYWEPDRPRILSGYRKRMAESHPQLRMHRPMRLWDGTGMWFDASASLAETPYGALVLTIMRDITAQKRAEDQLRTERGRLDEFLSAMRVGTWDWNIQTGEVSFDKRWAEIVGYDSSELPASIETWHGLVHPEDRPVSGRLIAEHIAGAIAYYDCECRMRHKDGHWVWVHDRGRVVAWSEDGRPFRMAGTHTDITERKQMEAMLRKSRDEAQRLALIAERTTDAVAVLDEQGRIEWVNPGFERMMGYPMADVAGRDGIDWILHEQTAAEARDNLRRSMFAGVRQQVMGRIRRGGEIWLDLEIQPIRAQDGRVAGFSAVASDVTAHVDLRKRLEGIVDALAEGLVLLDAKGIIVDCNPRAAQVLGLPREQLIGRYAGSADWGALGQDGVPLEEDQFPCIRTLTTGEPVRGSVMAVNSFGGKQVWIEVNSRILRDGLGNVTGEVASFADVTDRRRMQQAILDSEARLRTLADSVPVMVWLAGPEGDWTDCNRSWLDFTGRPMCFGQRLGWTGGIHPEDLDRCLDAYAGALSARKPLEIEFRLRRKDGTYRWILDRCAPRYASTGELLGFVGGCVDITERRETEQKLVEANLRARHLAEALEQAPASIFLCDKSGAITYVNRTFCQVTGFTPEEVLGKNPRILQSGQTPPPTYREMWTHLTSGRAWRGELLNRKKSGELYWELMLLSPLMDDSGGIAGYLCVKEDITSRKRNEQQLEQANKRLHEAIVRAQDLACQAEAANVSKSEFLANMSHEIRTPMNGILGTAGLLLETVLTGEQREHVDVICTSAESLLTIINDLLDLSKIEAGRLEVECIEMSPGSVVMEVSAMLSPLARQNGLEFETKWDSRIPEVVLGDPGRLRQVLVNLAGNAVKFTESGKITIEASVFPGPWMWGANAVTGARMELEMRIAVRDTGIGIPQTHIDRLFDKFTQLDASTTRRYGGTGLGLSISRRLVEMMGGEIGVVSEVGRGSEFWFTVRLGLPDSARGVDALARSASAAASESGLIAANGASPRRSLHAPVSVASGAELSAETNGSPQPPAGFSRPSPARYEVDSQLLRAIADRKATILLAEDNAINRRVAIGILKRFGIVVDAAIDGQEAVDALGRGSYDLVLMDIHMRRLDGLAATRAIRALDGPVSQIPIIAMTASVMAEDHDICFEAGMNDFVSKPVDLSVLAEVLNRWLVEPKAGLHAGPGSPATETPVQDPE